MPVRLDVFRHDDDEVESYGAGKVIFTEGDPGESMYVVERLRKMHERR